MSMKILWNVMYTLEVSMGVLATMARRRVVLTRAVSILKQSSESQKILQSETNQDSLSSYPQQM